MFFKELVKLCEKTEQKEEAAKFEECSKIASEISRNANDMMDVGRIDQFGGGLSKLVMTNIFCSLFSNDLLGRIDSQRVSFMQGAKQEEHIFIMCFKKQTRTRA